MKWEWALTFRPWPRLEWSQGWFWGTWLWWEVWCNPKG